ncbi:MAG: PilX N-terminal domain-containing pilus assembly protein [Halioglobus sp.]
MLSEKRYSSQAGTILVLALVFLALLGMLSATLMQTSVFELRMARNLQFQLEAFHRAQGIASAIADRSDNFLVDGGVGQVSCNNAKTTPGCTASIAVNDPNIVSVPVGVNIDYEIERLGPLFQKGFPGRLGQGLVSSSVAYEAAVFETRVAVDASSVGQGASHVALGVAVLTAGKNP